MIIRIVVVLIIRAARNPQSLGRSFGGATKSPEPGAHEITSFGGPCCHQIQAPTKSPKFGTPRSHQIRGPTKSPDSGGGQRSHQIPGPTKSQESGADEVTGFGGKRLGPPSLHLAPPSLERKRYRGPVNVNVGEGTNIFRNMQKNTKYIQHIYKSIYNVYTRM